MRYVIIACAFVLVLSHGARLRGENEASQTVARSASGTALDTSPAYPVAPGVWYPGEPLPEKPMRYYRVRCFPGCHRGSSHGKYPDEPLNMRPIFPTSTIDRCAIPGADAD